MYKEHFGLDETPFSIAPDPRYLFMSEQHREALAHLVYGVNSDGGFVLLTGEVGTGKTTVCRCLLEQLPCDADVAFVLNPALSVTELLGTVCDELGIDYPEGNTSVKAFVDRINTYLLDAHARGRKTVVIIEEAQNLSADVLEQLRLLTNLETNQRKLLQIIMIGQPELREMLARPELRQLAQRITARYHMGPLSRYDVTGYVNHRLSVAGLQGSPFTASALSELWRLSRGIPRTVNVICDRALLGAYVQGQKKVGKATLSKAAGEVFGERPAHKRTLKWVLTGCILIISVTALAATFYNRKLQLLPGRSMQPAKTTLPAGSAGFDKLDWPSSQPIQPSREMAYQALFKEWGIPCDSRNKDSMCKQAKAWGLECTDARGNLSSLLQMNKPAVLRLSGGGRKFYATLIAVKDRAATVVVGPEIRRVDLNDLLRNWPGTYTLLRRAAPQYREIKPGDKGPDVQWLENQLALIQGDAGQRRKNEVFDSVLSRQVEVFQSSEGLKVDGIVGPQTFIHLNAALSRRAPALSRKDG